MEQVRVPTVFLTHHSDAKVYVKGKPADIHESHHHVMPLKTYLQVFGALMFLTVITGLVSYADLGPFALGAAMLVAVIKAGFVVGYFMHLKFDTRFHSFIFFGTMLFVGIFFVLTTNGPRPARPSCSRSCWRRSSPG